VPSKVFRKELIIGVAVFFGGILIITAGLYFVSNDIALKVSTIVTDRALLSNRSQAIDSLAGLKKNLPEAERYTKAIGQILVQKDQLIDFGRWLDGLARSRQVAISSALDGTEIKSGIGTLGSIGFNIDASGGLPNLLNFIQDVELRSPRFLVDIVGFEVTQISGSEYKVASRGKVYFK
jgi:hypothetical protein